MVLEEGKGLSTEEQQYDPTSTINVLRRHVDRWRALPDSKDWGVTRETARLLQHWRHHDFSDIRPFFCQVEAVETVIWLTEVAPRQRSQDVRNILKQLDAMNEQSNPGLARLALKLATGSGQDDGHGDAHRLADGQRCEATDQPEFHPWLPCRDPRPDHPGPAASAPAERSRQLLRES